MSTRLPDQPTNSRAFAVGFKNLRLWSVGSFGRMHWQWPEEYIRPLADALVRRFDEVDRKELNLHDVQLITIHFDGTIDVRPEPRRFKGRLFFTQPGDVVYSKIDVRNGAIAIVPEYLTNAVVSSEFPVYQVRQEIAMSGYIKLLFKTSYFRQAINGLISGASGRKRVQPQQLAALEVPIPPLPIQRAIWRNFEHAQKKIAKSSRRIERIQHSTQENFLHDLGVTPVVANGTRKAFAVQWSDMARWSVRSTNALRQVSLTGGKYPLVLGQDCLVDVRHGCSCSPSPVPTTLEILKISAITRGQFLPNEKKYIQDHPRIREEFELKAGDVLMCRTNGTLRYVGMSALVTVDMRNLIFPDKIIRVRVRDNILPEYLWVLLQSAPVRAQIEAAARTAVGNYAIGSEDIWNLKLPLPPLPEQKEIVRRVRNGKAEIECERHKIQQVRTQGEKEVEEAILGIRPVLANCNSRSYVHESS